MKSRLVWTSDPEEAKRLCEQGAVVPQRDAEPSKQTIRGAGGTAKDGEIELQGDYAARVAAALERFGYRVRR